MTKGPSRPKILLVTLPHPSRLALNVPMAAGYLKGIAHRFGLLDAVDVEILPPRMATYLGCRMLIDTIIDLNPTLLGFTLYLWNVERSLYIARAVKERLPHVQVIVGGPEVSRAALHILSNPDIDVAVHGEGELTFVEVVKTLLNSGPDLRGIPGTSYRSDAKLVICPPRQEIVEVEMIPSPYLMGYLDPRQFAQMMIFTTRGCLQGCSYCSWSGRGRLRPFGLGRLREELRLAHETEGITKVGIFDSAFNLSPIFMDVCRIIEEINHDGRLHLTCFLQAECVDEETAKHLRRANFASVEVGLQSSNATVLGHIGRRTDLDKFVSGVRTLEREGIRVKVDTILGLPGDSKATFEDTMDFCAANQLNFQICNLSLAHGTVLRRQQQDFGLKIGPDPPYFVRETETFTRADLDAMRARHLDRCLDMNKLFDLSYPAIVSSLPPRFPGNNRDAVFRVQQLTHPIRNIVLRLDGTPDGMKNQEALAAAIGEKAAGQLSVLCLGRAVAEAGSLRLLKELLSRISALNPYLISDVLLAGGRQMFSQKTLGEIAASVKTPDSFVTRRDEIFPDRLPHALRRSVNVLVIMSAEDLKTDPGVEDSNCLLRTVVSAQEPIEPQVNEAMRSSAAGLLVEFGKGCSMEQIRGAMSLLIESEKNVFFPDWALQGIWESEWVNFPSSWQSHYELAIDQDGNTIDRYFDEDELWMLTVSRLLHGTKDSWLAQHAVQGVQECEITN